MLTIGLTGGIGSGKSFASEFFARQGIPVIDADIIAHQLVEPNSPALNQIIEKFGADFVDKDGRLNRDKLRNEVFSDKAKRQQLEAILHPRIHEEMQRQIAKLDAVYCVLCIPLLIETRATDGLSRILVIDVSEATQIERVIKRDKLKREQISAIIKVQAKREDRLSLADDVINNDGQTNDFLSQLESIHQKYLSIAQAAA